MMPNMVTTIFGLEQTIVFQLVEKTIVGMDLVETTKVRPELFFEGVIQPIHPKELLVKPEGERKFQWWNLITDLQLEVDQIIKDEKGSIYRVMSSNDWSQAGFYTYQLTEGPGVNN